MGKIVLTIPPLVLTHGVRVQMLINRDVGNSNKGSKRWMGKLISTNAQTFDENIIHLKKELENTEGDVRIYSSINARNTRKAAKCLMVDMIEKLYEPFNINQKEYFAKMHDNYISKLCKPECSSRDCYLIDDDVHNEPRLEILQHELLNVIYHYPTVRGYHYIASPFDVRIFEKMEGIEIKKDSLMLVGYKDVKTEVYREKSNDYDGK